MARGKRGPRGKWPMVKEKLFLVEMWCRDGLTEKQICKNLGVAESTFHSYKQKYPELVEALKKGKEVVDYEVENSLLYKRFCVEGKSTFLGEP